MSQTQNPPVLLRLSLDDNDSQQATASTDHTLLYERYVGTRLTMTTVRWDTLRVVGQRTWEA